MREGEDFAGYLVAEALGIPHAGVIDGSTHLMPPDVVRGPLDLLRAELGLGSEEHPLGPYRYLLASWLPRRYLLDDFACVPTLRVYRQTNPHRPGEPLPDWLAGFAAGRPLAFASLGTLAPSLQLSEQALRAVVDGLAEVDCAALVAIGVGRDPAGFGPLPDHLRLVNTWLPQSALLERCAAFVTHAGFSSVREGLRAGVPMLAVPFYDDQPHAAERIARIGAGLTIPGPQVTAAGVADAVGALLRDPSYRQVAAAVRRDILASPSLDDTLCDLAALVRPPALRGLTGINALSAGR